jgi:small conductance mechanosensitive channel
MPVDKVKAYLQPMMPHLLSYALRIVGVLFVLWLAFKIARAVQDRLVATLQKREFDETLGGFFGAVVRWLIIVGAGLACLSAFGIQTTSFAAIIGAAGLAVGLGFQSTLSSFAAGVLLLVFRPFKMHDVVEVAGKLGVVHSIGLFTVALDTLDNRRIIVPNSEIAGKVITNISENEYRRVDIDVGAEYSASIDDTRAALERAAESIELRDEERGYQVFLKALGGSSVDWQVRVWCNADDYWVVWEKLIQAIKHELDEANIGIPFPQMDVHVDGALDKAA